MLGDHVILFGIVALLLLVFVMVNHYHYEKMKKLKDA